MCRKVQELHGRIAEVPTAIPQPVPEDATNQTIPVVISTPTCLSFRPLGEISPFPSRLGWCSNPHTEISRIIRNLGFWQPSWVISSLLLSDSRRQVCCVARSISCCLFRAWGLGAWEESTIRSCSYTRMNPHRKEREGPEVPCVQNRWR